MDLSRKLGLLRSAGPGGASPGSKEARISELREALTNLGESHRAMGPRDPETRHRVDPSESELGERMPTAFGAVHRVARPLAPSHCHGKTPVAKALTADPAIL